MVYKGGTVQGPDQGYINHIGLVLDASDSMRHLREATVQVADNQVSYLAQRSRELDQETRMTCYTFNYPSNISCVYYDKDVLRMQSLKNKYRTSGNTALIDATLQAIRDLKQTATLYGDHAFLLYVLTDGQENSSRNRPEVLKQELASLPNNWTVAVLVPDNNGVFEAKKFGFLPDNIAKWDTTAKGIQEVGEMLQRQTDAYMTARSQGIRPTSGIFSLNVANLTPQDVQGNLTKISEGRYQIFPVSVKSEIRPFVESRTGRPYEIGKAYYQFTKTETIQASKNIVILDKTTANLYTGGNVRALLGLDADEHKISPANHPNFEFFIQSKSVNRKLIPGQNVLVLK